MFHEMYTVVARRTSLRLSHANDVFHVTIHNSIDDVGSPRKLP